MKEIKKFLIESINNIYIAFVKSDDKGYICQVSAKNTKDASEMIIKYFSADNMTVDIQSLETDDVIAFNYDDLNDYANTIKSKENIDIEIINKIIK